MNRTVWWEDGGWTVRGKRTAHLVGRSSFKWPNLVSMHFAGNGDGYPRGALYVAHEWVRHCQELFGREDVVLRVLGESAGWPSIPAGSGMFGSPPNDAGIHDVPQYRQLCQRNERITELTELHKRVLEEAFRVSDATGCIFEWVIDATLKHTEGMCVGVIDHAIRQVGEEMRALSERYPGAAFIVSARNEWDAHNHTGHTLTQVNQWARRWYRWRKENATPVISFESPGTGWEAEQWPEAMLIVDHGGQDIFDYDVGPEPGKFKVGAIHPARTGGPFFGRDEWWDFTDELARRLRDDSRGQAIGVTESMYLVSKSGTGHWYRNRNGWNDDLELQLRFYESMSPRVDYEIVHDDIGAQTDAAFADANGEIWESMLAEFYWGRTGPPPPPSSVRYRPPIELAYRQLLGREPDPDGLRTYNDLMTAGMSEASMREALIRSNEYEGKNPA